MGPWNTWLARSLAALALAGMLAACGGASGSSDGAPLAGVMKADLSPSTDPIWTGSYWDPSQPGTGFFFEKQGTTGTLALYLFESTGRSVWYSAAGELKSSADGFEFAGALTRYVGGQHAKSNAPRTPAGQEVGSVAITFSGEGKAHVRLSGREFDAQRLALSAGAFPSVPTGERPTYLPETGIYWNPAENGRGYTIEVINGYITVGIYHYDEDGRPIWHLVTAPVAKDGSVSGDFASFRDGQALAGPYRAPTRETGNEQFRLERLTLCNARISFPGMDTVAIQRFVFNPSVTACRLAASGPSFGTPVTDPTSGQVSDGTALAAAGISLKRYTTQTVSLFQPVAVDATAAGLTGRRPKYSVVVGSLPAGVQLDSSTGRLAGTPTQTGTFKGQIGLSVDGIAGMVVADFEFQITPLALVLEGSSVMRTDGTPLSGYRFVVADPNGQRVDLDPAVRVTVAAPSLPPGLTVDPFTGVVTGTPARVGSGTSFVVLANVSAMVSYKLIPVTVSTTIRFELVN